MAEKYTPSQKQAVEILDGDIIVSASAGSGKTFVMIERLIKIILEGKAKTSEILAVTFTEAAAAEMKQKLVDALRKQLVDGGDNERIRTALEEVPTASISTIHKFCADALRSYFYEIGLDPTFKIADETIANELRNRAANKTFERLYDARDERFLRLVRLYRSQRSDQALKDFVFKIASAALSRVSPEEYFNQCRKTPTEADYRDISNDIIAEFNRIADDLLSRLDKAEKALTDVGVVKITAYADQMRALLKTAKKASTLRDLRLAISAKKPRAPTISNDLEEKAILEEFKKAYEKLVTKGFDDVLNIEDEERAKEEFFESEKTNSALADLAEAYLDEYSKLKTEESVVDFSDLEHLAYKLLTQSPDALASIRAKYKYAFCDEYQDVNQIQESILSLVAPNKLFMVGDVKQCIYAFRGCDPSIFADKFDDFEKIGKPSVRLSENFRSTQGVLKAVNNVFSSVMTKNSSGVDYKSSPMLFGGLYPENTGEAQMIVLVGDAEKKLPPSGVYDLVADAKAEESDDCFYEGAIVGKIIEECLGSEIYDLKLKAYRKAEPKDVAVLLRNSTGFASEIVKTLSKMNIPVASTAKNPILDYPEIKLLVDVLSLIDFYADDAPLVATLKSAIGGFSEEELASIRSFAPVPPKKSGERGEPLSFSECFELYRKKGDNLPLKKKAADFSTYFQKIRLLSEFCGAGELLWKIIKDTGLDLEITAEGLGKTKLERIRRFISESEVNGEKLGVKDFLKRIDDMGDELSLAFSGGGNSVSIMTAHASKGLEFPIVIIAGLDKNFNMAEEKEPVFLSKNRGISSYYYDEQTMTRKTTVKRIASKLETRRETAREELRLLYVAMTRAQSKLFLVSSVEPPKIRTDETALSARRFADFFSESDMPTITVERSELKSQFQSEKAKTVEFQSPRPSLVQAMKNHLDFVYPFVSDCSLPVKRSVTELAEKDRAETIRETESGKCDDVFPLDEQTLSDDARKTGIAYHKFLELWNFKEKNVDNELIRQLSSGNLSQEQADLLNADALKKIIGNDLFLKLGDFELRKEQPFISKLNAKEVGYDASADVLVQGVIDLLAVKGNKAIIIDYKASRKNAAALLKTYRPQLALYKKAIEKTLKLSVEKTLLLNLFSGELIEVDADDRD